MRQSTKDHLKDDLAVIGGVSVFALIFLYIALVAVPSWWHAHQDCQNGNGVVLEQKDFLRPTICLKINPGVQQ